MDGFNRNKIQKYFPFTPHNAKYAKKNYVVVLSLKRSRKVAKILYYRYGSYKQSIVDWPFRPITFEMLMNIYTAVSEVQLLLNNVAVLAVM